MYLYYFNIFKAPLIHTHQYFFSTPSSNDFKHIYKVSPSSTLHATYLMILYYVQNKTTTQSSCLIPRLRIQHTKVQTRDLPSSSLLINYQKHTHEVYFLCINPLHVFSIAVLSRFIRVYTFKVHSSKIYIMTLL